MFIEYFFKSLCNCFKVATGKSSISWKSFCYYQKVPALHCKIGVIHCKEAANVCKPVFLCTHCCTISIRKYFLSNLKQWFISISLFSLFNKVCILCKTAGINE